MGIGPTAENISVEMGKQFKERARLKKEILASVTVKLLPCPFCGSSDIVLGHDTSADYEKYWSWYVECSNCDVGFFYLPTKEEAVRKWNSRII